MLATPFSPPHNYTAPPSHCARGSLLRAAFGSTYGHSHHRGHRRAMYTTVLAVLPHLLCGRAPHTTLVWLLHGTTSPRRTPPSSTRPLRCLSRARSDRVSQPQLSASCPRHGHPRRCWPSYARAPGPTLGLLLLGGSPLQGTLATALVVGARRRWAMPHPGTSSACPPVPWRHPTSATLSCLLSAPLCPAAAIAAAGARSLAAMAIVGSWPPQPEAARVPV